MQKCKNCLCSDKLPEKPLIIQEIMIGSAHVCGVSKLEFLSLNSLRYLQSCKILHVIHKNLLYI